MKKEYIAPSVEEIKLNGMTLLAGSVNGGGGDIAEPPGWGGAGGGISDPDAPEMISPEDIFGPAF